MTHDPSNPRLQIDGKFFRRAGERHLPKIVTYGPLPGGWPAHLSRDFRRMTQAGFDAIRTYALPDRALLDSAAKAGLQVFAGHQWEQNADFLNQGSRLTAAKIQLASWLAELGHHPALSAIYVGNEIPTDLVRWMGPHQVLQSLEELIAIGKEVAPDLLFAYANFPGTEYLEPTNADFTAFNIYLENEADLDHYLKRLHHVAGDRPLVISEFGLDSQRNGLRRQAELLSNALSIGERNAIAAFTVFAWSDLWLSGGIEVLDWDFGITDRLGHDKPALAALKTVHTAPNPAPLSHSPAITAIVCTRNGRNRIASCLKALEESVCEAGFEIIVVDDGSIDGTADFIAAHHPRVRLLRLSACGLSAARNAAAESASTPLLAYTDDDCEPDRHWLARAAAFLHARPDIAAVGGPNLPPHPRHWREAVVTAAPGAPSHVMIDDLHAEHLPGCNLVVRKSAWREIGGFDSAFHTAGDDVDFCWRLHDAGYRIGFDPGAFVWHWRRSSLRAFLRQQIGYGQAERQLMAKHPERFGPQGSALWKGVIYTGAPVRVHGESTIYHGTADHPAYHPTLLQVQPVRDLPDRWKAYHARLTLCVLSWLAPALRAWHRTHRFLSILPGRGVKLPIPIASEGNEFAVPGVHRDQILPTLLQRGWQPYRGPGIWDLEFGDTRILIATELGEMGTKRTLVRHEGKLPDAMW